MKYTHGKNLGTFKWLSKIQEMVFMPKPKIYWSQITLNE